MANITYNQGMGKSEENVTALYGTRGTVQANRARFVHKALKEERWSIRQAAARLGFTHTTLTSRCNGGTPFLADELEHIAFLLKIDPIEFYAGYINAGNEREEAADAKPMDYKAEVSAPIDLASYRAKVNS